MALAKMKIKISSTVKNEDDPIPEYTSEDLFGYIKHNEKDGVVLLSYKSESEGNKTETNIEPRESVIRLVRRGAIESEMLFEVGVTHKSVYKISPFAFDMSLTAKKTECSLSPFGGTLTLEYEMTVGGAKKDCLMKLTATPVLN